VTIRSAVQHRRGKHLQKLERLEKQSRLGRALTHPCCPPARRLLHEWVPRGLGVGPVSAGSGGLWHTPRAKDAYLDETFDDYRVPAGDASQLVGAPGPGTTGPPDANGPRGGIRETCNWIAAAAVAEGIRGALLDYAPIYASPIGAAFASWVTR